MDTPKDDFFEAQVERALRPYRGRVSDAELAALEAMVRDVLENDPTAKELLAAARPHATRVHSGPEPAAGSPAPSSKKPADEG
jgi:hypothetical protein